MIIDGRFLVEDLRWMILVKLTLVMILHMQQSNDNPEYGDSRMMDDLQWKPPSW